MPTERNTLYNIQEVAEMLHVYKSIAYARIAVDLMDIRRPSKKDASVLRIILEDTIPHYEHVMPLKIKHALGQDGVVGELGIKCATLLSKL